MVSKSLCTLLTIWFSALAPAVIAGAFPKRDDSKSLFNPETNGLPHKQDVTDFTKMIPAVDTKYYFERTFALVAYALAQHADGELVKALFHEVDGSPGIYGLYYYEPVGHAPSSTLVGYEGLLDMEGNEPKDFKTRWWIAALWGVMKTEWETYYDKLESDDTGITLKATNKGEKYENALVGLDFFEKWTTTPVQLGKKIDGKAAHWLMTVLLRRNVIVSRYGSQKYDIKMEDVSHVKEHSPILWVGNAGGVDIGDKKFQDYTGYWIQAVQDDDGHSLDLSSPLEGRERGRVLAQNIDQQPFFYHLQNLDESWASNWYEKDGPPTTNDI